VVSGKNGRALTVIVSESWGITQDSNTVAGRPKTDYACLIGHWATGVIDPRGSVWNVLKWEMNIFR
jgi:hypothetical protein